MIGQQMTDTLEAAADLSALQYHFVKIDASGNAAAITALTDIPVGVLQNKPTAGQNALICYAGRTPIVADAAISAGDSIGPSADGQGDPRTLGTDTTHHVAGTALTAAAAAGEHFDALIFCIPNRAA